MVEQPRARASSIAACREPPAEAVPAQRLVDPEDLDLGVAAPGEAVDSGHHAAARVAQEARERAARRDSRVAW
jgi:hypothetical protein